MAQNPRYSVGSLSSLGSFSSGDTGVDSSFVSQASTTSSASNSYEIESEVGREALKEICCSALSRILDFPDDGLEVLLGYDEEDQGYNGQESGMNVAKNIASSFRMMKRGLSALSHKYRHLNDHKETDNQARVPKLTFGSSVCDGKQTALLQLITHMHTFTTTEGLFRKPGNKHRMESLVQDLETKCPSEVFASRKYNAHDYASVLKKFFSDLPEPILMKRHLDAYFQASVLSSSSSKICCLQLLMLLLPPLHRVVLQHLLDLLAQVARFPENLMDAQNLALVFAPTLFLASRYETLSAESLEKLSSLLKIMINKCDDIFEVPAEVQVVAEKYCRKRKHKSAALGSTESLDMTDSDVDGIAIDMYTTSCRRQKADTFHQSGQGNAVAELASLYEVVKNMPDGPQKTHFLKRFESASKMPGTPVYAKYKNVSKSTSKKHRSLKKNKENATPRIKLPEGVGSDSLVKPCFKKGSLIPEFDLVEQAPPCQSSENTFKTPSIKRCRMIHTMSPIVTDV